MLKKKQLVICLGSSCFARGNKQLVKIVKQFIDEHKLAHRVNFKGKHCFGDCQNGPAIQIDEKRFNKITLENIREILDEQLLNTPWD